MHNKVKEDANSSSSSAGVADLSFAPIKWGDLSDEELGASARRLKSREGDLIRNRNLGNRIKNS